MPQALLSEEERWQKETPAINLMRVVRLCFIPPPPPLAARSLLCRKAFLSDQTIPFRAPKSLSLALEAAEVRPVLLLLLLSAGLLLTSKDLSNEAVARLSSFGVLRWNSLSSANSIAASPFNALLFFLSAFSPFSPGALLE